MIKPIDTQILYPQTPELANRQHTSNQLPTVQQEQFAHIMQKEVKAKKDTITPTPKTESLKVNKDSQRKHEQSKHNQKKKSSTSQKETEKQISKRETKNTIDIRI